MAHLAAVAPLLLWIAQCLRPLAASLSMRSAPSFLRSRAHTFTLIAATMVLATCRARDTTAPPVAARLDRFSGHAQTGVAGQALSQPLVVAVTTATGTGVAGISVTWTVTAGNGSLSSQFTTTDAQGHASVSLTLGPTAGSDVDTVTAGVAGLAGSPVVFAASATAGTPAQLTLVSGDNQTGTAGDTLPARLVIAAQDQFGNPTSGVPIAWTVTAGGGGMSSASGNTDGQGYAAVVWTLGPLAGNGNNTATATASGLAGSPVSFTASATAGPPSQLVLVSGNNQVDTVGRTLPESLVVEARDQFDNAVAGAMVMWAITIGGGTLSTNSNVTDAQGRAATSWTLGDSVGTQHASASLQGAGTPVVFTATGLASSSSHLAFTGQPSASGIGLPISPPVELTVQDGSGNTVVGFAGTVTVALAANPTAATLGGTTSVTATAGVATFSDLVVDKIGSGYTLSALATGLTSITSDPFDVTLDGATNIAVTVQPTDVSAGSPIAPAVEVRALDGSGSTASSFISNVTLTIGANPGGATLSGTLTVAAVAGVATFDDLSLDRVASGYTLIASTPVLPTATTATFDVTPGPATQLEFTTQPGSTTAGATLAPIELTTRDAFGNIADGFAGDVTLAIGTNPGGATLSGTATMMATNGLAVFNDLSLDKTGAGYTLVATAINLPGATSSSFDIAPGTASQLAFTVQPTDGDTNAVISPIVEVAAQDALGNTATAFAGNVSIAIGTNPSGGSLSGTTTVAAVGGIAAFGDLRVDKEGSGYTLVATSGSLSPDTSTAFDVTLPLSGGSVLIAAGDGQSGLAGYVLNVPPAVLVRDAADAPLAGVSVTFAVASGGGSVIGATTTTDANGVATIGGWIVQLGANTLTATVAGSGLTGNPVTFTATGVSAAYHIDVRFLTAMTPSREAAFTNAAAKWEALIYGDVPDVPVNIGPHQCGSNAPALHETIDDIVIFATVDSIDGPGQILGQAGPCFIRSSGNLPLLGVMMFDSADVAQLEADGEFSLVILHEMGHVLGYGTVWSTLGLLAGAGGSDVHFTGAQAIAAFDRNGGQSYSAGSKVPVENCVGFQPGDCGAGTQDSHWRESVFANELMTGYLNSGVPNPLSVTSTASMGDLGYTVNYAGSDPYTVTNPLAAVRAPGGRIIALRDDILRVPVFSVDAAGHIVDVRPPR